MRNSAFIISIYLRFREHQRRRDLEPLRSAEIFVLSELLLQFEKLLGCEGGPRPPGFAQQCMLCRATYDREHFVCGIYIWHYNAIALLLTRATIFANNL